MTEVCEAAILSHLSSSADSCIEDTFPWSEKNGLDHGAVVGAVKSLMADGYVTAEDLAVSFYSLSKEAEIILKDGSQEMIVMKALIEKGKMEMSELQQAVGADIAKIGMGNCMKNKWVKKEGADLIPLKAVGEVEDETQQSLRSLVDGKCAVDALDDKVRCAGIVLWLRKLISHSEYFRRQAPF